MLDRIADMTLQCLKRCSPQEAVRKGQAEDYTTTVNDKVIVLVHGDESVHLENTERGWKKR